MAGTVDISNLGSEIRAAADMFVTPMDYGAAGDNYTDDTVAVQAALDSGNPVYLDRYYAVTNVQFPQRDGVTLIGNGPFSSGLRGTSSGAFSILQTFDDDDTSDYRGGHYISNFGIIGVGQRAFVIAQIVNSIIDGIHLVSSNGALTPSAFGGGDQFVFEEAFGNIYRNLRASSVGTGGSSFKVNATCLDSIFDLIYTNSVIDLFNLDINSSRREVANTVNGGFGHLTFNTPTMQGARRYAVKVVASQGPIAFNSIYIENCLSAMFISAPNISVNDTVLYVESGGSASNHSVWVDQTDFSYPTSTQFKNCQNINSKKIIIGDAGDVQFIGGKPSVADGTWHDDIERASTNYCYEAFDGSRTMVSFSPLAAAESGGARGTALGMKCTGTNGKHTIITVDDSGTISAETPYTFTDTSETPRTVVCGFFGTSSPAWTSGVAITPIVTRGIGGDGTALTYSYTGDLPTGVTVNASTGEVSGTPTETGTFYFRITATDGTETASSRVCAATVS